jgi:hemolysin activation/secretion protein
MLQKQLWAIAEKAPIAAILVLLMVMPSRATSVAMTEQPSTDLAQASPKPRTDPNQDRFLQPPPTLEPATPETTEPILPTPEPSEPAVEQTDASVLVKKIEVVGSTIFNAQEINSVVQPYEGKSLTLEELRGVADAITQLYLNRGYITSRAILVNQTITNGLVQIRVVEGRLEQINVEGNKRVKTTYIRKRIRLGTGQPLKQNALEDQLRLLKADPLLKNVEASLRAGDQLGESTLAVRVTEANPFDIYLSADNYSPPSVGSERIGISAVHRNLAGIGDQLGASYYVSTTGGAEQYDFSYRVPINAMNGTIQLRAAPNNYKITDPEFSKLGIRGSSELYEISYRQPLVRSPREELALSLGFTFQDGQTFLFNDIPTPFAIGTELDGTSHTRVLKLGQDYVKRDTQGAWALRSQFNLGFDVFNATVNPSPIPDGRFFSWLGQAQRVQRLGSNQLLIAQLDLQLTPDSLLPSQQFVVGGGQSVRGFRQNVRSGDNGVRFSLEDRIALQRNEAGIPTLQLAPFADVGAVWNVNDNPNKINGSQFLAGVGAGLLWQPVPRLDVRLDYALPLVDLSDRGENAQDEGFYFSLIFRP